MRVLSGKEMQKIGMLYGQPPINPKQADAIWGGVSIRATSEKHFCAVEYSADGDGCVPEPSFGACARGKITGPLGRKNKNTMVFE